MFENGTETTQRGLHVTIPHKQGHGKSTVQEKRLVIRHTTYNWVWLLQWFIGKTRKGIRAATLSSLNL